VGRISLRKFSDFNECTEAAAELVQAACNQALSAGAPGGGPVNSSAAGTFLLGLAGGKTPGPLYTRMAELIDPLRTETFIIDERNVPWTDENSNYRLVRETFWKGVAEPLSQLHDFRTGLPPGQSLESYERELRTLAPRGFDLLILGAGNDGHFASIFPGFEDFDSPALTCRTETENFAVRERFSLTPSYLWQSRKVLLLLRGKEKAALISEMLSPKLPRNRFPLNFWAQHPGLQIWYGEN
jgi:6-phosphogluconolactonase